MNPGFQDPVTQLRSCVYVPADTIVHSHKAYSVDHCGGGGGGCEHMYIYIYIYKAFMGLSICVTPLKLHEAVQPKTPSTPNPEAVQPMQ